MKAILISDHAKWCALMMNGYKTIEVRTSKALYKATQKLIDEYGYADIYVYCSKDDDLGCIKKISKDKYVCGREFNIKDFNYLSSGYNGKGKVVFKFRCYKVEEITVKKWNIYVENNLLKESCLHESELFHYIGDFRKEPFYAIHISDLEIFDGPKELNKFKGWCDEHFDHWNDKCLSCKAYRCDILADEYWCDKSRKYLTKAPQNFTYIEVE